MKTNYLQRNRNSSNHIKILTIIAAFVVGVLIFSILNKSLFVSIAPVWVTKNVVTNKFNEISQFFRSKDSLIRENQALNEKLIAQEALAISYSALESSHAKLLNDLGRLPSEAKIAAGVIMRPPQTIYDLLVLGVGEREGVLKGDLVTLPFGPLVGTISKTSTRNSEVTLYTSYGIKTEAILERGGVPVTLEGRGGGMFEIKLPRDIPSEIGDRVLSPNLDARLLGVVKDISALSTDSFKTVLVSSPANLNNLNLVLILK